MSETPMVRKEILGEEITRTLEEEKSKGIAEKYHVTLDQVKTAMRSRTRDWEKLLAKRKAATDGGDCSYGRYCQKFVCEDELPQMLSDGGAFVATLPSGKCVVSNDT